MYSTYLIFFFWKIVEEFDCIMFTVDYYTRFITPKTVKDKTHQPPMLSHDKNTKSVESLLSFN